MPKTSLLNVTVHTLHSTDDDLPDAGSAGRRAWFCSISRHAAQYQCLIKEDLRGEKDMLNFTFILRAMLLLEPGCPGNPMVLSEVGKCKEMEKNSRSPA